MIIVIVIVIEYFFGKVIVIVIVIVQFEPRLHISDLREHFKSNGLGPYNALHRKFFVKKIQKNGKISYYLVQILNA